MTAHNEMPRYYLEPALMGAFWVVQEIDPVTEEVVAEYGYPTEDAAWGAYAALTKPKGDA